MKAFMKSIYISVQRSHNVNLSEDGLGGWCQAWTLHEQTGVALKKLEICLSPRWDLNPGLSLVQIFVRRMRYQPAKGKLTPSELSLHFNLLTSELAELTLLQLYQYTRP